MGRKSMNVLQVVICAALVIQLSGCGTILYPERKGQRAGRIDVGVALLDGIGLLTFLIPGIIAFAVDFNNGTIYVPGTGGSSLNVKKHTGYAVNLNQPKAQNRQLALNVIKGEVK